MKPIKKIAAPAPELTLWLQQFDFGHFMTQITDVCESIAMIIVNQQQQVLLWSRGAEKFTGTKQDKVVGKPCSKEFRINQDKQHTTSESISLTRADGHIIEVDKYTQVLFNNQGEFSGGIVLLKSKQDNADTFSTTDTTGPGKQTDFYGIISRSPTMQPVFQLIQNAAKTEATVLVRGESGSGKELVAHAIHDLSHRQDAPFLAVNCAALSATLLESELFGHVRGAFTGAVRDHSGLFQRAHGGTLFLDEVAEIPLQLQAKLLRVIQERNYLPVGATQSVDIDVRLVAATHRSLRAEVKAGNFREDLMYRLRVVPIFLPPLRERREDINVLLWYFIRRHNKHGLRKIEKIDPQAMQQLLDYPWPGNIRELQNVVEYSFAVGRGTILKLPELPPEFREESNRITPEASSLPMSPEQEADAISQALEQSGGKITSAANLLGMSRATFWRKRKLYDI